MRRILIAGGGTGGHLFPGLAVAERLRDQGVEVSFVGTRRGIEARLVPGMGYPLHFIDVAGLKGRRGVQRLRGALRLPAAAVETLALLLRLRPDAVIGVGGYASGPVVMLAALLRIPTAVLEQNSVPGVTNRILGRVARRVFTAFPEAGAYFPREAVRCLGNPIRRALARARTGAGGTVEGDVRGGPTRVLVLGGSQGAHGVNELVYGAVQVLARTRRERLPRLLHQAGTADSADLRARYQSLGLSEEQVCVEAFIEDMGRAYADSDLVIGRAGATTLAEITALGLPAILIPFPQATDDHQTRNARWLESQGAALLLVQETTTPEVLAGTLLRLCDDPTERQRMATASKALGRPDAASAVAGGVLDLLRG